MWLSSRTSVVLLAVCPLAHAVLLQTPFPFLSTMQDSPFLSDDNSNYPCMVPPGNYNSSGILNIGGSGADLAVS
jgi:hypothetical protein